MFVTIFLLISRVLGDDGYCSLGYRRLCQGKGMHVACQFPEAGPGPLCQNYSRVEINPRIQKLIIDEINRRRQHLAAGQVFVRDGQRIPQPRAMMLVSWDQELAYLAQRLADQCQFVHDECRATVRYPYAGQSVGEVRTRRPIPVARAIARVIAAWWSERRHVRVEQLMSPFRPDKGLKWGHFSQLSIWNLQAVGCGATTSSTMLLVCDFSHTNMLGQTTLVAGPVGECPAGTRRRMEFPLLCAPMESPKNIVEENREEVSEDIPKFIESSGNKGVFEGRTIRPKWRRTRTKWNQRVALNLDKEDLEQLYRDTGFRVNYYEKKPTSLNK
ncbi:venom allergen 3-like [Aricia agestis]|uniref:venom allergen 3-like n=1 Tax=Aricia agestis TaxID=91739 RepID=UPI001C20C407|nr:venom allergen 3-like [Aricia agestis]